MIRCRLCKSNNIKKAFLSPDTHGRHLNSNKTYQMYYCRSCSNYFLYNEETKKNYYKKAYPKNYYPNNGFFSKFILSILNLINHKKYKTIIKHFPEKIKIKILDVGCGTGEFLKSLPSNRFQKFGIEINPQAAQIASSLGLKIIHGDINRVNFKSNKFDCVTMWHVFEHLPNPTITIQQISKILKPNGLLIFTVPNSNSIGFKYGQENFFHLDSPRHLFIPNELSIKKFLKKSKFNNITFKNPFFDYPLDLFWSVRKKKIKYLIYPLYFVFKILSRESLQISTVKTINH